MKIKYDEGDFRITEEEFSVKLCRLIAFMRINGKSKQARKFKKQLEKMEDVVAGGIFKN